MIDYECYIGKKFGKLTILSFSKKINDNNSFFLCSCECGKVTTPQPRHILKGNTKSCGCARIKHRMGKSTTYNTWRDMIQRCTNPNAPNYKWYGARGISVCDEWTRKGGFMQFLSDMGDKPTSMWIERLDNEIGYSKENCIWATPAENLKNKRNSKKNR
jgi:hypothetical protein